MALEDKVRSFDPSAPGSGEGLWGLPFTVDEAALVVLPVPWDVTVSYRAGASRGPAAILEASAQVDLFDPSHPDAWKKGIAMAPMPEELEGRGEALRASALEVIEALSSGEPPPESRLAEVNRGCAEMVEHVRGEASALLDRGKIVAVLGGDHSVPLGLMQALGERHPAFGILHLDAHSDLRHAYEGFVHSHASIMDNALRIESLTKIVQVGVRDTCEEEVGVVRRSEGRVSVFDFRSLARRRFGGASWMSLVEHVVSELPGEVYVSFDIDGLDPALCPGTGTPVPGGLQFEEALSLVEHVVESGRSIVGFDLCEVSPRPDVEDEWDANVGARMLYRLCCTTLA